VAGDVPPYRVVALDIDGTILDSRQRVTDELKAVLARLSARSVRAVLCTGRRWSGALPVLRTLEHGHPIVVCSGGALIKDADTGRTLRAVPMPRRTAQEAVRVMRRNGLLPMVLYDRPAEKPDLLVAERDRPLVGRLPYAAAHAPGWEWYAGEFPDGDEPPLVCYAVDERGPIEQGLAALREALGEAAIANALGLPRYGPTQTALEVHDPGATKWLSLAWLLERWGMGPADVVAIGDDVNDVPMLRAAGLSFAMGNAPPSVKAEADAVTGSNDEHGVVEALTGVFGL